MISGLFINSSSVSGSNIRLQNNQSLRGRNFLNSSDIDILKINTSNQIEFSLVPFVAGQGALALASSVVDYSALFTTIESDINSLQLYQANYALLFSKQSYTVVAPIVANTEIELSFTPIANSIFAHVTTGPILVENTDYTLSGNTVTILAASVVVAELTAGDSLLIQYARLA